MRRELKAFGRGQVWLALLIGSVGFGGFFAVYSYITPTLTTLAHFNERAVPIALALWGLGMTVGTIVGGRLADWSIPGAVYVGLGTVTIALLVFTQTVHSAVSAAITMFVVGGSGSLSFPALQTRLMDAAEHGQNLAGSLNHSAFNLANALGAFLGGTVIAAGYGYAAPSVVGAVLAVGGMGVLTIALLVARRVPRT
jgi:DHA1 family inner membrane transport protein